MHEWAVNTQETADSESETSIILKTPGDEPKKILDDPDFETFFDSVFREDGWFIVNFHHDSLVKQPVWMEGAVGYELSKDETNADETSTLKVKLVNGEIPYFKLHIGRASEIFEFGLKILNVQSYPSLGGEWTVSFTTIGTADLIITPAEGTRWDNSTEGNDLRFLELRCGNTPREYEWVGDSIVARDYSCPETSYETSKVLTSGRHALKFKFGGHEAYAKNLAGSICGVIFSNISYELKNSSGGDVLMIDCAGNLYIGSESVYLNTRPPSAPQDGLGILVDGDYNYTFNSTHAYIAGNISGETADLPTLTSYDILIKNSSNLANLTIFQGLSGNISTRGKAVYVGAEMGSCSQTGETYFSDVCSTGFQLQDNTNTCRSSTYAAGCTGSSQCNGDAPGSCGDGSGTCSSSCSYSACDTGCDGLCSVYSGTCTSGSCDPSTHCSANNYCSSGSCTSGACNSEWHCSGTSSCQYTCNGAGSCSTDYNCDSCTDCSCSCGGYNVTESVSNGNCEDGLDNDCDGNADNADPGCVCQCSGTGYENKTLEGDVVYVDCNADLCWTPTVDSTKTWGPYVDEDDDSCIGKSDSYPACYYCDNLDYGGFTNWTCPTYTVMQSLCNSSSCEGACFGGDGDDRDSYWSSSEFSLGFAINVWFYSCDLSPGDKGDTASVRCVLG